MSQAYREELVHTESEDGIRLDGVVCEPAGAARPLVVVQIPGGDVRAVHPLHVAWGRALAGAGYRVVTGDTRGSMFGDIMARRGAFVVVGSAWERFAECVYDVGPWVAVAEERGAARVVLLGHSFGAAKAVTYQAARRDPRVVGLIAASPGPLRFPALDPAVVAEAERLVAVGRGTDLLPWGAFGAQTLSAQTLLDWTPGRRALLDVFGSETPDPPLARLRVPLLACYGTAADLGSAADLERLARIARSAPRVDTQLVPGADHMYSGQEAAAAAAFVAWLDVLA